MSYDHGLKKSLRLPYNPGIMLIRAIIILPLTALALTACDQLGLETPAQANARVEADGKAVGGACRHAGRALEDCYELNRRASKAAVYAGWREMDAYMRENGIAVVVPSGEAAAPASANTPSEAAPAETPGAAAADAGSAAKPGAAGAQADEKGGSGGGAKSTEKPAPKPAAKNAAAATGPART